MSLVSCMTTTNIPAAELQTLRVINGKGGLGTKPDRPVTQTQLVGINGEGRTERIRNLFDQKAELSASAHDTAWVAMVHSPASPKAPSFPSCVSWILENQEKDGSWGTNLQNRDPNWLVKDALSSTLACVLALKRWGIGEQHIHNALGFMERHSSSLMDPSQQAPLGFDIIFPVMIQKCTLDFNLNLPLRAGDLDDMLRKRELALNSPFRSSKGRDAYLAYVSEGMGGNSPDHWKTVVKFKRKNGSLFNSPSATAAMFMHHHDADSLRYLRSVVDFTRLNHGGAVPAIYPHEIHARLCLIDAVESLGVRRHFRREIEVALDEIYKGWQQGEEEIFLDVTTCAMAFRILRMNGYTVTPADAFGRFSEDNFWTDTLEGYLKDERAVLELLKASQVIFPNESILEDNHSWASKFLLELHDDKSSHSSDTYVSTRSTTRSSIAAQVHDLVNYPLHADLERLSTRRKIKQYQINNLRTLKSSFRWSSYGSDDLLKLAVEDFNFCQSFHQEELKHVMRWLKEYKLDDKRLAKVKIGYGYFSAAANFFEPELAHARISWTKHGVLTALIDDLYDDYGTSEEQLNLLDLLERWDVDGPKAEFCSKEVETLYWALHSAICETVENALVWQGRNVMNHVVELWVDLLRSMLQEAEWARTNTVPTLDEYMRNAATSFALGPIVVPTVYLLGPLVSDEVAKGQDLHNLFQAMSISGRLLNDCISFEREAKEGKPNAVPLLMMHQGIGNVEEALGEIRGVIENKTRELLSLVLDERKSSTDPKECRELFWIMNKVVHLVYQKGDAYNSTSLVQVAESVIKEPISIVSYPL